MCTTCSMILVIFEVYSMVLFLQIYASLNLFVLIKKLSFYNNSLDYFMYVCVKRTCTEVVPTYGKFHCFKFSVIDYFYTSWYASCPFTIDLQYLSDIFIFKLLLHLVYDWLLLINKHLLELCLKIKCCIWHFAYIIHEQYLTPVLGNTAIILHSHIFVSYLSKGDLEHYLSWWTVQIMKCIALFVNSFIQFVIKHDEYFVYKSTSQSEQVTGIMM